jgi:hypothetical protein
VANKYHGNLTGNGKHSGGAQSDTRRGAPSMPMPEKTASWPGVPGKTGPNRSGGTPKKGKRGPFHVKHEGM